MGLFGKGSTRRTGEAKSSKSSFSSSSSSSSFPADNCRNVTITPSSSMSLEAGSTRLARSGADPRSTSSSSSSGSTRTPSGPPPSSRRAPPTPTIQTSWGVEEFGRENTQTWKRTLEGVRQETVTPASHSSSSAAAAATGVGAVGSSSTSPIGARGAPIQSRFNERDSARARMSIVSSPRSSVYASPMASPLSANSEARGRFDGEGGTGFVARPPRRESLMIDTRNFVLPLPSPKRLSVNAVASGLIIPDSPSNFFDANLPVSPVSLASPPPQTASMAYNSSPGNYYHGASPSPSPSRNSSNSLLGGMATSSPRLSPSLFATTSRNDHGSPDTTVSSLKVGTSSISSHDQSHHARPPSAIGTSGMTRPGAESNVTRLQELSINPPEATGGRSNGSRDNSPLGHVKAQQDGALRRTSSISSHDQSNHARPPSAIGTSGMTRPGAESNVTRLQELSINSPEATGQRSNGSRDNSPLGHAKAQQDGALRRTSSISSHDQSHHARPLSAIGTSVMTRPGAESNVTRLQELSINSPEATGQRSNGSRDNSPLGHAKAQQDGALRTSSISSHDQSNHARPPSAIGTSVMTRPGAESNVTRLQELSINPPEATGRRSNGSRDNSPLGHVKAQQDGALKHLNGPRQQPGYEGSPSRQPVLSSPSTGIPSLQTRRLTRAAPDDPFAEGGSVRSVSQNNPRAQALAAARERNTSSSGHSDADSPSPILSPRLTIRTPGGSTFEKAVAAFPVQVLRRILAVTKYDDFRALRATSRALRRSMDEPLAKEFVLQRYLGPWGYRSYALGSDKTPTSFSSSAAAEPIVLTLRDLDAFLIATEIQIEQYARFAKEYNLDRLHATTLRIIRASTRAWNRVVLRLRWQLEGYGGKGCWAPYAFEGQTVAHNLAVVFRSGRALTLRTWVPLSGTTSWMADSEVVECEREIWRSGVWGEMRRGDVVVNTAIAPFGNLGKLIFDGKFLRDFGYRYDVVGHLPNWLGMLSFSPQYYHNIVAASTASPVFYLWLQKFAAQAHESLVLCEEKVHVTSPQRGYMVKRFMYRVSIQVRANDAILDISAPKPQIVHPDWVGTIMIEIEGTSEHRRVAMEKIASPYPTPWRILREKSRPGKLWIRPVSDQDAV